MTIRSPSVVAVAQLPPPVTGLSAVSQRMVDLFSERNLLLGVTNVGPPAGGPSWAKLPVRALRTATAAAALVRLKRLGAKTLYMPTDSQKGLALNIAIASMARWLGYRVIFHHHNFSYIDRYSPLMARLIAAAPDRTLHVMLCSGMQERFAVQYEKNWRAARAEGFVLPNAFMSSAATSVEKPTNLTIGHLSNLTVAKGALRFIELFRRLREAGIDVAAEIAGPCHDEEVHTAIQATITAYPTLFRWAGPLYGAEKESFYRRVHVFVFPTAYPNEAQPLVLLEALAHGAAILATNIGCIGCDHAQAPGKIFEQEVFDDEAFAWISEQAKHPSWQDRFTDQALGAFDAQRNESLSALSELLTRLEE